MTHNLNIILLLFFRMTKDVYSLIDKGASLNSSEPDLSASHAMLNKCNSSQIKDPKRWGPKCENACNCKNNTWCLATGACPNGCRAGWERFDQVSPCYRSLGRPQIGWTLEPFDDSQIGKLSKLKLGDGQFIVPFSFVSEIKCFSSESFIEISWTVKSSIHLAMSHLYILYRADFAYYPKFLTVKSILNVYSTPVEHMIPLYFFPGIEDKIYFKFFKKPVLLGALRISFLLNRTKTCVNRRGTGITVIYGAPVCPYRRWGLKCEHFCNCPCDIPKCHPVTGSCVHHLVFCSEKTYGRDCERHCSPFCSKYANKRTNEKLHHAPRDGCHVVSGFCQSCPSLRLSGQECESEVDPDQVRTLLDTCANVTIKHGANVTYDLWALGKDSATDPLTEMQIYRGKIAMLVVLSCFATFILSFGIYVICVKFWARKKLRAHIASLERQRTLRTSIKSWSELREEFKAMHKVSSQNFFSIPKKLSNCLFGTVSQGRRCSQYLSLSFFLHIFLIIKLILPIFILS